MKKTKADKGMKAATAPYDPGFVEMVKTSAASKHRTEVDPKNVWASLSSCPDPGKGRR